MGVATPDQVRVGFGLSDPVTMAETLARSTAKVSVQTNLMRSLREEVKVLSDVDSGLVAKVAKGRRAGENADVVTC